MEYNYLGVIQAMFAIATAFVADRRGGHPFVWLVYGVIFGPLAFAVSLTSGKRCKDCRSWIPKEASVCRECTNAQ
jgi:hypothetical protein